MPMIFNLCGPPPAAADPMLRQRGSATGVSSRRRSRERVPWTAALAPPGSVLLFRWRVAWALARAPDGGLHPSVIRADDRFRRCRCASARRHWYVAWTPRQVLPDRLRAPSRDCMRARARPPNMRHAKDFVRTQAGARRVAPFPKGGWHHGPN